MRTVVEAAGSYLVRWREARRSVRLSWIFSRDGRWTQNGLCPKRQFRLRLTKGGGRGGGGSSPYYAVRQNAGTRPSPPRDGHFHRRMACSDADPLKIFLATAPSGMANWIIMVKIPVLRWGQLYESLELDKVVH